MKVVTTPLIILTLILLGTGCTSITEPETITEETPKEVCGTDTEEVCKLDLTTNQQEETKTPIYVTFTGHIEDNLAYTECSYYKEKQEQLIDFAQLLHENEIPFNLQASYEWFLGTQKCETLELLAVTDDMSVMDYLHDHLNVEIDVHQEGASEDDASSDNNLADIRYLAGHITNNVTETTGFQWDNQDQFERLNNGEPGRLNPDFVWYPEILAGGVSVKHTNGDFSDDMTAMGVWIPEGFNQTEFYRHNLDNEGMIYVGSGPNQHMADWGAKNNCHFESSADFIEVVYDYIEIGKFDADQIYTYTYFIPQKVIFDETEHKKVQAVIDQLADLRESNDIIYMHFTDVVETWQTAYGAQPSIITYDQIHPDDYTCSK
ncbi:MAG: hypothetical protein P8J32_06630 [bacterium]|nr:hypothetical protein [bacterium]